ncbi:MAG: ATP-binding protein [Patescibacteria group bacterium]|nr:ATP-binding protein [Patescibacteria group bacterium]
MKRSQFSQIIKDLEKKMVFIVGPRQVGKTWLAKEVGKNFEKTVYLNFDSVEDRKILKEKTWPRDTELLILDELHKMKGWKNYLKGVYDTKDKSLKILVTGSARLNTFRQSGDSLSGRFFLHRLLPFSLTELKTEESYSNIDRLIERGGFPEPFLASNAKEAQRWRNQYIDGLIRTDILDFKTVHDLRAIQMVLELLRRKVGSPISYTSIAEDVQISPVTVKRYIDIFEELFIVFKVAPYSRNIARSILKEPKIYFFDNGLVVGDDGSLFENFVAVSLFKHVIGMTDYTGEKHELKYMRTKEGKEVDFALIKNDKVEKLIEVKKSDNDLDRNLKYFSNKFNLPGIQLVKELKRAKSIGKVDIVLAENYLKELFL